MRVPTKKGNTLCWQDSTLKISPPEPYQIELSVNMLAIHTLKGIVQSNITLEIDLFMFTAPVKEKDTRPFYPYVLMMVDAHSGMLVGNQLLSPLPTLEAMWGTVPAKVAELLAEIKLLPKKILISSDLMYNLLSDLSDKLGISLEQSEVLPNLDEARDSLLDQFE